MIKCSKYRTEPGNTFAWITLTTHASTNLSKTQHVQYFLDARGSRTSNMTFPCVMKVMRISLHICISLHFFACLYISLHFSAFLCTSCYSALQHSVTYSWLLEWWMPTPELVTLLFPLLARKYIETAHSLEGSDQVAISSGCLIEDWTVHNVEFKEAKHYELGWSNLLYSWWGLIQNAHAIINLACDF